MEDIKFGGRPPNTKIKFILREIMREIGVADVNLARNSYIESTGNAANYHTIKKYLDQLTDDNFLRIQVVQDNLRKVEMGKSQVRRRIFLYQVNEISRTADNSVN